MSDENLDNLDERKLTPLMRASRNGDVEAVRDLLNRGAYVDYLGYSDMTALTWAAWEGRASAVELLLDSGADIAHKSIGGSDAFHLASSACATADLGKPSRDRSKEDHEATVLLLLNRGAYVDTRDRPGRTPLMEATNDLKLMQLLLDWGADINAVSTRYGKTALVHAVENERLDSIRFLLEHGAADLQSGNPLRRVSWQFNHLRNMPEQQRRDNHSYDFEKCHARLSHLQEIIDVLTRAMATVVQK
jgi:ankyrin repeat protein